MIKTKTDEMNNFTLKRIEQSKRHSRIKPKTRSKIRESASNMETIQGDIYNRNLNLKYISKIKEGAKEDSKKISTLNIQYDLNTKSRLLP